MNILMIHPHDIHSNSEPWTVRIVYLAKEFVKKGHNVKLVYFPLTWNKRKAPESVDSLSVIPFCRKPGIHNLIGNIVKLHKMAKWSDIIHLQKCFYHASLPAVTVAASRGKPLHYDWDDWELKIYEVSTRPCVLSSIIRHFLKFLESTIPKIADTISCASTGLKVECEKLGISKTRIFDAHVGADTSIFNPDISGEPIRRKYKIEKPLVLYLGQLHGGQYVKLFIEIAAKLVNEYKRDLRFMVVGDGYQAKELKDFSRRLNLDGNIIFTGAVFHREVPGYIAAADICVACFEDNDVTRCKSPLKIVEYMSCGKAIVATGVGEVPGMIDGAGLICPPSDICSMASAIARILDDHELKRVLETSARKRAQIKYNWTVTSENLLCAYDKAIEINGKKAKAKG